jgi:hypothetical protein
MLGSVAAGAGRQCAPAALIGRCRAALNFTVRRQTVEIPNVTAREAPQSGLHRLVVSALCVLQVGDVLPDIAQEEDRLILS